MRRGEIWWASLPVPSGSEPGYRRPVLVVQADEFNQSQIRTVMCAAITSNLHLAGAPGNVALSARSSGLPCGSSYPSAVSGASRNARETIRFQLARGKRETAGRPLSKLTQADGICPGERETLCALAGACSRRLGGMVTWQTYTPEPERLTSKPSDSSRP